MNSSNSHGSTGGIDPLVSGGIILLLFGLGLSSAGREVIDHPHRPASLLGQALAWPFRLALDQGWAQLTPKGEVGPQLWLAVLGIEAVACGIVIAAVVLVGVILIQLLSRERRGRKKNEV